MNLSAEQELFQRTIRDFAREHIAPVATESDERGEFPIGILKRMAETGLLGLCISQQYGGCEADAVSSMLAIEELARVCAGTAISLSVHNALVCGAIERFGTEEQKQACLPLLAHELGAFALTEPSAGSCVAAMATNARHEGNEYVLNGRKHFVTNAAYARFFVVFAVTDESDYQHGITAFMVEKDTTGLSVGKHEKKMGIRASNTCELLLDSVRVAESGRLGSEGGGFKIALSVLDGGRLGVAAQALGIGEAAYEAAVKYSKERVQFNQPICNFQAIQWMLADMHTQIEAARLLIHATALRKDAGKRFTKEAAMAKLFASEMAIKVADQALQIHGGYGYMKGSLVERLYRDARVTSIYAGTNEIQRMVIARSILD